MEGSMNDFHKQLHIDTMYDRFHLYVPLKIIHLDSFCLSSPPLCAHVTFLLANARGWTADMILRDFERISAFISFRLQSQGECFKLSMNTMFNRVELSWIWVESFRGNLCKLIFQFFRLKELKKGKTGIENHSHRILTWRGF